MYAANFSSFTMARLTSTLLELTTAGDIARCRHWRISSSVSVEALPA
jgi:hypothetical protein